MLLFAAALLAVVPAPTRWLWKVAVVVTGWGHLLAFVALLPLLPGWTRSWSGRVGGAFAVAAALLALTPLARAVPVARELPERLTAAFGCASPAVRAHGRAPQRAPDLAYGLDPLDLGELFFGADIPPAPRTTRVYAVRSGDSLRVDIYHPPRPHDAAPGVLVVHGGGWRGGTRRRFAALNHYLAARGYVVASIEYRLAPEHPFPAAYRDVLAALDFLRAHAAEFGLDPGRIVLLGRSAGAQLALLAAYTADDPGAIEGAISFYGPTNLRYGYRHPADPDVIRSRAVLEAYLGGPPRRVPRAYYAASPVHFVGPETPPTLLIHGGLDELVSPVQSKLLARRLERADVPHLLLLLPWATHGCDFHFSGPCGQLSTYAVLRFLAAVTQPSRPIALTRGADPAILDVTVRGIPAPTQEPGLRQPLGT